MKRLVVAVALALGAASAYAEPPNTHEIIYNRPSGFWTSNRPAIGGAYRYRLLLLGVVIAGVTGYLTWRAIRRAEQDRTRRSGGG